MAPVRVQFLAELASPPLDRPRRMTSPYPKVAQVKGDSDRLLSPDLCWGRSTLSSTSPLGLETTEELPEPPTPKQRQLAAFLTTPKSKDTARFQQPKESGHIVEGLCPGLGDLELSAKPQKPSDTTGRHSHIRAKLFRAQSLPPWNPLQRLPPLCTSSLSSASSDSSAASSGGDTGDDGGSD
ncbi:hypothetical protein PLICRDRAFT_171816 [Plicaturopsis crispa FD-325 SS-3]|nr:hypothetical protein PLICRDRAFT_171816 [Plicaturopsis crispa FD-325 SS-3]